MKQRWIEHEDYYVNEDGLVVFTAKYLLERGYCCGNGCRHCPYNYEAVPEPKRSYLLAQKRIKTPRNKYGGQKKLPQEIARKVTPSGKKDESFFEQVFDVARMIPKGRITSYGAIAEALGTKLSARMVGWAMNGAHKVKPKVPAHRVVNRNGMLSGKMHFATPTHMQELLEKEGVKVVDDKVVEFEKRFWNPIEELNV